MEKKVTYARMVLLVLAVAGIFIMDIRLIRNIRGKNIESYSVQNYQNVTQKVKKGSFTTQFKAVSSSLVSLKLWTEEEKLPEGTISYCIVDENGESALEECKADTAEIWNLEQQRIELDVSKAACEAGAVYFLKTDFQLKKSAKIVMDAAGIMHTQEYQAEYQKLLYGVMAILHLLLAAAIGTFLKWGLNDRLFLGMFLVTGVLAVLLTAPFSRDDEFRHFGRAYDFGCGGNTIYHATPDVTGIGNIIADPTGKADLLQMPKELSELRLVDYEGNYNLISYFAEINIGFCVPKLLSIFSQPEEMGTVEVSQAGTVYKGLESYWPQAVMIALGRLLGVRSGYLYYMAGIGQVVACAFLLWFGMHLTRYHKNLIWLYSFIPPITLLTGSSNPDGLMMAEMVLSLCIILHLREEKLALNQKRALALLVLYLFLVYQISLMKIPYMLLCLGFLLLLGKENVSFINWKKWKQYRIPLIMAGVVIGILLLVYLLGIRKGDLLLAVVYRFLPPDYLAYILAHPKSILSIFLHKGYSLTIETLSSIRGSYYLSYGVLAVIVLLFCQKKFSLVQKGYQCFLYLLVLGLVVLVGYTLTPPDYGGIWGITYRYMLPALPILGLALPFGNEKTQTYAEAMYPLLLIPTVFANCLMWL